MTCTLNGLLQDALHMRNAFADGHELVPSSATNVILGDRFELDIIGGLRSRLSPYGFFHLAPPSAHRGNNLGGSLGGEQY
jgi:hypothetical protein